MLSYMSTPLFLAPIDDKDANDDFTVLTSRAKIKSIAKDICDTFHHPVTILDINRLPLNSDDSSSFRIESDLEYFSLRYACRIIRKCSGFDRCLSCDKFHAKCMDINVNAIQKNIDSITSAIPSYFCDEYTNNLPHLLSGYNRPVMEYRCPILGYRELLFPINYENRMIGALFVGQIVIKTDEEKKNIAQTMSSFFSKDENKPERMFRRFIDIYNSNNDKKIDAKKLVHLIQESDKMLIDLDNILSFKVPDNSIHQYFMNFNTEDIYHDFIGDVCEKITAVEKELIMIANKKRKEYFKKTINKIVNQFFDAYRTKVNGFITTDKHKKRRYELQQAWIELSNVITSIKDELNIEDITIFGDGEWVRIEESVKKYVYPKPRNSSIKCNWSYDFSTIDSKLQTAYDFMHTMHNPEIYTGLITSISNDNLILVVCHDIAVALQVNNISENFSLYTDMSEAIGTGIAKINGVIALCSANLMKERHVLTLRMNRHESAHISTKLNDNMKRYFSNYGRNFINQSEEKQRLIVVDMQNTIRLISHMASNIGLITGSINESSIIGKSSYLDVFDLLYKWQIMFRNELKERNLDIVILRNSDRINSFGSGTEDGPRSIYIHPELFELLVYNLVDNAVKYAHRGSIIYLSWHKKDIQSSTCELTITSYGPHMDESDLLYELYARGDTAQHQVASGDGIGLYVVRRAARLLNISVSHTTKFINKYHLPLISWYLKESFENKEATSKKDEISRYIRDNQQVDGSIINENDYTKIERRNLSKEYLIKRIDRETWITTFSVVVFL